MGAFDVTAQTHPFEEVAIQAEPTVVRPTPRNETPAGAPRQVDARRQRSAPPARIRRLTVRPVPGEGWSLLVDDVDEPAWTVTSRAKAVSAARKAARHHDAQLIVEKRRNGGV